MKTEPVVKELLKTIPQHGKVTHISKRTRRREIPQKVEKIGATIEKGLDGDHFNSSYSKKRQVTLIQKEHLDVVASILGMDSVDPLLTRRNIVVEGINLLSLRDQKFKVGEVTLFGTGYCHPCSRMEENLGPGGWNAMRGHGGITAEVLEGGEINLNDPVVFLGD